MSRSTCSHELADLIVSKLFNDPGTARLSIAAAKRRSSLVYVKPVKRPASCSDCGQMLLGFAKECGCQSVKPRRKAGAR